MIASHLTSATVLLCSSYKQHHQKNNFVMSEYIAAKATEGNFSATASRVKQAVRVGAV